MARRKTNVQVSERSTYLKNKWTAYYFRFKFEQDIFEKVILEFRDMEVMAIEEMLKELHDSMDMASYSYGKLQVNTANAGGGLSDVGNSSASGDSSVGGDSSDVDNSSAGSDLSEEADTEEAVHADETQMSDALITYCNAAGKNVEIQYRDNCILKIFTVR